MVPETAPEFRGRGRSRGRVLAAALALAFLPGGSWAAQLAPWTGPAKPPLELDALDRSRTGLGDFSGRPVIVHFFATWCPPCIDEMESLVRLSARIPPETMGILAVDVGEVPMRVTTFFAERPVGFPVLLDQDRTATRAWEVVALPSSYVLDARHRPVLHAQGDVDWDATEVQVAIRDLVEGSKREEDR